MIKSVFYFYRIFVYFALERISWFNNKFFCDYMIEYLYNMKHNCEFQIKATILSSLTTEYCGFSFSKSSMKLQM